MPIPWAEGPRLQSVGRYATVPWLEIHGYIHGVTVGIGAVILTASV